MVPKVKEVLLKLENGIGGIARGEGLIDDSYLVRLSRVQGFRFRDSDSGF